jgi:predicted nucleotide-binding protein
MFAFLRALGIEPIEWSQALAMSGKPSPYVGEILEAAFEKARAIVVLMTPDDVVQLRSDLLKPHDKPVERQPTGQARPNVLFEAGLAFGTHPDRTVLVELGYVKEFSDVGGRHVVHMNSSFEARQSLAVKLRAATCDVDTTGTDWVTVAEFADPLSRVPVVRKKKR